MKTKQTTTIEAEAQGYADASEQFKTQGAFSAGWTWDDAPELNEAYDRGVNRAEAEHNAPPAQARHSPLPWRSQFATIRFNSPTPIADCFNDGLPGEANAAFIVHACNNAQRLADKLSEVELRTTQARIASGMGKQNAAHRIEFLIGELERIATVAREALAEWSKSI